LSSFPACPRARRPVIYSQLGVPSNPSPRARHLIIYSQLELLGVPSNPSPRARHPIIHSQLELLGVASSASPGAGQMFFNEPLTSLALAAGTYFVSKEGQVPYLPAGFSPGRIKNQHFQMYYSSMAPRRLPAHVLVIQINWVSPAMHIPLVP